MIESKVREYVKNNDRNDREIREAIQSINQSIDKEDGAAAGRLLVSGLKIPVSVCMHARAQAALARIIVVVALPRCRAARLLRHRLMNMIMWPVIAIYTDNFIFVTDNQVLMRIKSDQLWQPRKLAKGNGLSVRLWILLGFLLHSFILLLYQLSLVFETAAAKSILLSIDSINQINYLNNDSWSIIVRGNLPRTFQGERVSEHNVKAKDSHNNDHASSISCSLCFLSV